MLNGFFMLNGIPLPISQIFKFLIFILMFIRVLPTKDLGFVLLIFFIFQLGPLIGFFKTRDLSTYLKDFIIAFKWFNVPLSFFYFKTLFQSSKRKTLLPYFKIMIGLSFFFICINQGLGILGFGQAFYHEGYANATGTKGFIWAGNELTILVLSLAFLIFNFYNQQGKHFRNILLFGIFAVLSFTITSKTVLAGVILVFLIPYLSKIRLKIKTRWFRRLVSLLILGIPIVLYGFYYGLRKSGFKENLAYSTKVNQADFWTVLLSNRNNFAIQGWDYFVNYLNFFEKLTGLGEGYYLEIAEEIAEIDFVTLLFSGGILSLVLLLFIIYYWLVNASLLTKQKAFVFAKPVLVFIVFICVAGNTAGHVFNSGIAGFYTAMGVALMFYKISLDAPKKIKS